MPAKKLRVEVFDEDGDRYTITFDGRVTRKKVLFIFDIVELLGGVHSEQKCAESNASKFDKTKSVVKKHFPFEWFSSKEVLTVYEQEFKEPISLSTVSTYLARMVDRGFLTRRGAAQNREYRLVTKLAQNTLSILESK